MPECWLIRWYFIVLFWTVELTFNQGNLKLTHQGYFFGLRFSVLFCGCLQVGMEFFKFYLIFKFFTNECTSLLEIYWVFKKWLFLQIMQYFLTWLHVLAMSRTCFRVNPHSVAAWMSRNSLLKTGAKSEV